MGDTVTGTTRVYVDFNEMVTPDTVLLGRGDTARDALGNAVHLHAGMPIGVYMEDEWEGEPDNLIADGTVVPYDLSGPACWAHVKWCCRIDGQGIRHETEVAGKE